MADAMQQGIMGLQQAPTGQNSADTETINPELFSPVIESYAKTNPVEFGNDMLSSIAAVNPELVAEFKSRLAGLKVPAEVIDALGQMVDVIMGNPGQYAEIRRRLIEEDEVPEELLPEEFDPAFFAALNIALDQLSMSTPQEPIRMANGGIASLNPIALGLSQMGRRGDTMLAHITPGEARMLRRRGGSGTINPQTGLPEFFLGKLFKGIGNAIKSIGKAIGSAVKSIASSTIGKIVLTAAAVYFLGPAGLNFAGTAGSITGLTGSLAVGVNTFAASTLVGLASGQSLGSALKTGAIAGITAGFGSSIFNALPEGYEGGAAASKGLPPIENRGTMVTGSGSPPSTVPSVDAATGQGPAQTFAVEQPVVVSRPLTPADAVNAASDPVTSVPVPNKIIPAAVNTAAAPAVNTAAAPPAVVPSPTTLPPPANATFLRPEGGINLQGYSGEGIKIPGVAPTVQQVGIESLPSSFAASNVANTAAATTAAPPGFMESLSKGNFTDAAKAAYRNISPSQIQERGVGEAISAVQKQFPGVTQAQIINAPAGSVLSQAYKAALPGIVSTYGPLALAGLGTMALTGGLKKEQPEPPPGFSGPTGIDLLKSNPQTYGLQYGGTRSSYALNPYDYMYQPPFKAAAGGIASLDRYAHGGQPSHFPRKTGPINGPGTGTSDSIPAMLSDGEFVFTAKAVRNAGNGSRRAGAKKMYALMKALERKA